MENSSEGHDKSQIDAGRGIAKENNSDSNNNTTENQGDDEERLDDRVRKAGY